MSVIDEIKNKAKANKKTVVLPETTDMRTLTAAAEVISEGIADIILVGNVEICPVFGYLGHMELLVQL